MDAKKEDGRVEGGLAEGGYGKVAVDDDHQFGMKWKGKRKARATEPAIEYYDMKFSLTSGFEEKNTVGFYKNVKFNECVLEDASFQYCTFVNVTFDDCKFEKTLFANVYLKDVHFVDCKFLGHAWMYDRLESRKIGPGIMSELFPTKSKMGSGVPSECLDAGSLQMQLAVTDGSYVQFDKVLAPRLQDEENSKPSLSEPSNSRPRSGVARGGDDRQTWKYEISKGGPATGERAHLGFDAGIVTGYDEHGYPLVENPYFPSETSIDSAAAHGQDPSALLEGTASISSASGSTAQHHAPQRQLIRVYSGAESDAAAARPAPIPATPQPPKARVPHFKLACEERREREAAEAADVAAFVQRTARVQSAAELARIAAWNAETVAAQAQFAARLRDRASGRVTRVVPLPAGEGVLIAGGDVVAASASGGASVGGCAENPAARKTAGKGDGWESE
ncbi:hypothetical protein LTR91_008702 [Friedmanniomyces endolithicus]|uniref:Pentapeptide repeat-containing protein n=1 Tax=Friedmanniomyces endolithicus TaxID=329885 RepID=A0AAN6KMN2_9PEZI|nr:hypothetical protein LTR75_012959 [Friedmanniomyces endolithicus]KAK0849340.1 hypothetical protein LTR03_005217 [Friedmanniomyces endolithicus]KAK0851748.1 hypothetical protein LTS02_012652 [Friedmanniomyces endolithicus]KAK0880467.1 hypothetical protein LTR87_005746 [Friedmanniomyces endolithicus]KAK0910331.1 hypothetical protein LTR02_003941 [Friedmanniomyces endolithicus]